MPFLPWLIGVAVVGFLASLAEEDEDGVYWCPICNSRRSAGHSTCYECRNICPKCGGSKGARFPVCKKCNFK